MATEMKLLLSAKESLLLVMTLTLVPILIAELFGVSRMRSAFPAVAEGEDDDGDSMPRFSDLLISAASTVVIVGLRLVLSAAFKPLGRRLLSPDKRSHPDRVERFATVLFKFMFFVCISSVGYVIMREEPWFPPILGGHGAAELSFETLKTPPSRALRLYFLVQLGYHTHSLVYMVLLSSMRNDFLEMLLHHLATMILIGGSFLANFSAFGALVVFTHDIGDVTGYAIKSAVDTGSTPLVAVLYLVLLVSWAYTRLYVFPFHLLHSTVAILPVTHPEVPGIFRDPMNAMMGILVLLHVYWYTLFLAMGYNLVVKGVQEDIQQQCHVGGDEAQHDASLEKLPPVLTSARTDDAAAVPRTVNPDKRKHE